MDDPAMEWCIALTAAIMATRKRKKRMYALHLMDRWLSGPNGEGRRVAHRIFMSELEGFLGK